MTPLLTVAVPTFSRAKFLEVCLASLVPQLAPHGDRVELLVLDNASPDATPDVVKAHAGLRQLRYVRHPENIGSDRNIAASFDQARGRYVWVLGDDDVALDGTVDWLMARLPQRDYGLVYLRPFGFDRDPRAEHPGAGGPDIEYDSLEGFLGGIAHHIALISAMVVNKGLIPGLGAAQFRGTNLVHVDIYLSAALRATHYLYSRQYRIAYKRLNTGGFDFAKVFVDNLGAILDRYVEQGLPLAAKDALDRAMLLRYFPYHAWQARRQGEGEHALDLKRFRARFGRSALYWVMVDPVVAWPRPLADLWALLAILAGRLLTGDARRGFYFALNKLRG